MRFIIFLILTLTASTALAQKEAAKVVSNPVATGIAGEALNGSPVTDSMNVDGYGWLKLQVRLTRDSTTDIGFTCEESDDDTTWSKITKTAPDDTVTVFAPTFTSSVSVNWTIRVDVAGFVYFRCTFTGTSSGADDLLTVIGRRQRGE